MSSAPTVPAICQSCGKVFYVYPCRKKTAKYCSVSCGSRKRGEDSNRWKGGESIMKNGYVRMRVDGRYVYKHRYLMEKEIGRKLRTFENVHHIDGDKTNNDIGNLAILDIRKHSSVESKKRWEENPEKFRQNKKRCLQPRLDRHAKGKLCQCLVPCPHHNPA